MDTTSSSSPDSELELNIIRALPRPRMMRERNNPYEMYDDFDFKIRYRLSKATVRLILDLIILEIEPVNNKNMPISAVNQLCVTLRYFALGSFQAVLGDHLNIHKSTVCRIIPKVTRLLARLRAQYIKLPETQNELRQIQGGFYNKFGFPCVLGCIDGTHVRIQRPHVNNEEMFRNRKGWFSINTLVVCDSELKITNIVARWPGSVHDSTVFNDSALHADFLGENYEDSFLLGDSGYACKPFLLTPLLNPRTAAERRYNRCHIRTRNSIERTFGVWKRRFPCLSVGMRTQLNKTSVTIVATAVLHNIVKSQNDALPEPDINVYIPPDAYEPIPADPFLAAGNTAVRSAVINSIFN